MVGCTLVNFKMNRCMVAVNTDFLMAVCIKDNFREIKFMVWERGALQMEKRRAESGIMANLLGLVPYLSIFLFSSRHQIKRGLAQQQTK